MPGLKMKTANENNASVLELGTTHCLLSLACSTPVEYPWMRCTSARESGRAIGILGNSNTGFRGGLLEQDLDQGKLPLGDVQAGAW